MKNMNLFTVIVGLVVSSVAAGVYATDPLDGLIEPGEYRRLSTQQVGTGFGNNASEINGLFISHIVGGNIRLALSGNLERNGNTILIFVDNRGPGGVASVRPDGAGVLGSIGGQRADDWGTDTNGDFDVFPTPGGGSVLDAGFNPRYAIEISGSEPSYYVNIIDLTLPNDPHPDRDVYIGSCDPVEFGGVMAEAAYAPQNMPVRFAFNNSNVTGVDGFFDASADQASILASNTGLEIELPWTMFASVSSGEPIRLMACIANGGGDFLSNQFLPPLPTGTDNVGAAGQFDEFFNILPLFDATRYAGANHVEAYLCRADVGQQGGLVGADGVLDNNDFVAFIQLYFDNSAGADVGVQGGLVGKDAALDNNDFVAFIALYFSDCG